jgi:hypothetical protein
MQVEVDYEGRRFSRLAVKQAQHQWHLTGCWRGCPRLANCRTVKRYEGDLDHHFDQDQIRSLIERLTYSTEDERRNRPARHRIPIHGNVRNGTATLKSAVNLYKKFRENWVEGAPISRPNSESNKRTSDSSFP